MRGRAWALRRRLGRFGRTAPGASAVEFALVIGLAIVLLVGIFEAGRALHSRNALEYLADVVSRMAMVQLRDSDLSTGQIEALMIDEARSRWTGVAPDRLDLSVSRTTQAMEITLTYRFRFLLPMGAIAPGQALGEILLSTRRTLPDPVP